MFLLTYHVKPTVDRQDNKGTSGAFVNCYIITDSLKTADKIARREIKEQNWDILEQEDAQTVDSESIADDKREYYNQALIDKTVFVFYTYPEE